MNKKGFKIATQLVLTLLILSIIGCSGKNKNTEEKKPEVIELLGAGATFPYPLYAKMFDEYYKKTGVKVNYQSIGSGGGIRQLLSKTVDFGATDAFMRKDEMEKADGEILHIPTCLGAVAITYNLEGNPSLRLTPEIIADIFLGKITSWGNSKIKKINPGVNLPDREIIVVHRSDGSGTTYIFSDYLSKVSDEWETNVGRGKSLQWPVGIGAKGNEGVAGLIKQTPGSIGYVEFIYAFQNDMPVGLIKNKSGNFIKPSIDSVSLSANVDIPDDTRVSITNTSFPNGYPISSFTWLIFYREQNYSGRNERKARELIKLLWWVIHDGQEYTTPLHYAPLPSKTVKKAEAIIKKATFNGVPILVE